MVSTGALNRARTGFDYIYFLVDDHSRPAQSEVFTWRGGLSRTFRPSTSSTPPNSRVANCSIRPSGCPRGPAGPRRSRTGVALVEGTQLVGTRLLAYAVRDEPPYNESHRVGSTLVERPDRLDSHVG